ncbi:HEAT repeat domain-containing protein [Oculatella sp. FACHB-28]|uniref:HEAT repeat domain-containing protein n=1 Tax=Oculatella sp. FACHB-28 TaxID=2692845 RepID=UPI0016879EB0|nr:HEAT repeat domain-containing protein [Oculatella sp. FACHB-28]MBD2059183.1 HEAT repeat domain-containing protein [Oculatella sp. FACHB-28]
MAKSRKLEELIEQVNQFRKDPTAEASLEGLRQILQSKYSVAIASAAKLIGEAAISELTPDLVTAFDRLMEKPIERDIGCTGKFRIAEALYKMGRSEADLFLRGIRHRQMEPVWGGQEDTAPSLRGVCALGLVRMNYPDVMSELADLLADPIPLARAAAARAIAYSGSKQGVPLLRLRVKLGDEPQVLSDCFTALINLSPDSLPLVASFLDDANPQACEMAALALGESRSNAAFEQLKHWWLQTTHKELRKTGLLAIAMLRQDEPLEFLLSLVAEGKSADAKDAVAALSLYQSETVLWQRVLQAAETRGAAAKIILGEFR